MKVIFCVRHNFHSSPGGAQVQILKTKAGLEKIGVECDLVTTPYQADYSNYDIIHLTDLTWIYDILEYLREINKSGCSAKKVLSTIYWPFDDYAANGAPFLQSLIYSLFGVGGFERAKAAAKFILRREKIYLKGVFNNYIDTQRTIVQSVDLLLPNSERELRALASRLDVEDLNYRIVNNAVDTSLFDAVIATSKIKRRSDLVTFVARIDARKNQLGFLRSVMDEDFLIRFIGNPGPNSERYFRKLKSLAERRGNVQFISHISQEEVFKHMLEAKVNVLTSWIETPGLVSLEAAYAGCNIVVSDKGSVRDYFRDYAYYCDPSDSASIRKAVSLAMSGDYDSNIRNLISSEYSWDYAAQQTLDAYLDILGGHVS